MLFKSLLFTNSSVLRVRGRDTSMASEENVPQSTASDKFQLENYEVSFEQHKC